MRKSNSVLIIILLFIVWRFFLFLISYISPYVINQWGNRFPFVDESLISSNLPQWIWSWGNFDGVHYLMIARVNYFAYYTQTFFPVYPLLIRFVSKLFLFNNYLLSALFVSNFFFLICLLVFKKLLILDGYKDSLYWILLFLLLFPTSFYFGAVYTESIFLCLVLCSFLFARNKRWFLAGLFGLVASGIRLFGIFLLPALLFEYLIIFRNKPKPMKPLISLFLIPLGLIFYMMYLYYQFNDPLLFWHAQPAFGAERTGNSIIMPFQVIYRYLKILTSVSSQTLGFWNAFIELFSFFATSVILYIAYIKKIRISYLVFSLFCFIVPTLTGTFSSLPRYILIIFPIYIILGTLSNRYVKAILLSLCSLLLIIFSLFFIRGYWIS